MDGIKSLCGSFGNETSAVAISFRIIESQGMVSDLISWKS